MINIIVAVDSKMGIADEHGLPWSVEADKKYYRDKIKDSNILMGRGVYDELQEPPSSKKNYVLTHLENLREGFAKIDKIEDIIKNNNDLWVIGGEKVYQQMLDYTDKVYLTRIYGDFKCTKFFPEFENDFYLSSSTDNENEDGTSFRFEIYNRK